MWEDDHKKQKKNELIQAQKKSNAPDGYIEEESRSRNHNYTKKQQCRKWISIQNYDFKSQMECREVEERVFMEMQKQQALVKAEEKKTYSEILQSIGKKDAKKKYETKYKPEPRSNEESDVPKNRTLWEILEEQHFSKHLSRLEIEQQKEKSLEMIRMNMIILTQKENELENRGISTFDNYQNPESESHQYSYKRELLENQQHELLPRLSQTVQMKETLIKDDKNNKILAHKESELDDNSNLRNVKDQEEETKKNNNAICINHGLDLTTRGQLLFTYSQTPEKKETLIKDDKNNKRDDAFFNNQNQELESREYYKRYLSEKKWCGECIRPIETKEQKEKIKKTKFSQRNKKKRKQWARRANLESVANEHACKQNFQILERYKKWVCLTKSKEPVKKFTEKEVFTEFLRETQEKRGQINKGKSKTNKEEIPIQKGVKKIIGVCFTDDEYLWSQGKRRFNKWESWYYDTKLLKSYRELYIKEILQQEAFEKEYANEREEEDTE